MSNLRKYERTPYPEPVQYRRLPGDEPLGCVACDCSRGGLRFKSQDFIPLKTNLFFDMMSPTREVMQVAGKVVWVQRVPHGEMYQVGVEFESPTVEVSRPETSPRFSV